jgi:hypothetical protein
MAAIDMNTRFLLVMNLSHSVSFFCGITVRFLCLDNHGKEAGVAYIGDHYKPGKKFFTFGCGELGQDVGLDMTIRTALTWNDGVIFENKTRLQLGATLRNQDRQTVWYPIRELRIELRILEGAVNLEVVDGKSQ